MKGQRQAMIMEVETSMSKVSKGEVGQVFVCDVVVTGFDISPYNSRTGLILMHHFYIDNQDPITIPARLILSHQRME